MRTILKENDILYKDIIYELKTQVKSRFGILCAETSVKINITSNDKYNLYVLIEDTGNICLGKYTIGSPTYTIKYPLFRDCVIFMICKTIERRLTYINITISNDFKCYSMKGIDIAITYKDHLYIPKYIQDMLSRIENIKLDDSEETLKKII